MLKLASKAELRRMPSARVAAEAAEQRLSQLDFSPGAKLIQSLASRVRNFPSDLAKDIALGGQNFGLTDNMDCFFVVFAECGGTPACLRFDDGYVVALDSNFVMKSFIAVYFLMSAGSTHHRYAGISSVVLSSMTIGGPLPYQSELAWFALKTDPTFARTVLLEVVDYIALHEIGHAYVNKYGASFALIEVVDPKNIATAEAISEELLAGGVAEQFSVGVQPWSHWDVIYNRKTGRRRMLLPVSDEHELQEYGPDVFALYARTILDSQGSVNPKLLQNIGSRYAFWTLITFLYESIELELQGGRGQRRQRHNARLAAGAGKGTHPAPTTRNDVLFFHMRELLDQFNCEHAEKTISFMTNFHDCVWSEVLDLAMLNIESILLENVILQDWRSDIDKFDQLMALNDADMSCLTPFAKFLSYHVFRGFSNTGILLAEGKISLEQTRLSQIEILLYLTRWFREEQKTLGISMDAAAKCFGGFATQQLDAGVGGCLNVLPPLNSEEKLH